MSNHFPIVQANTLRLRLPLARGPETRSIYASFLPVSPLGNSEPKGMKRNVNAFKNRPSSKEKEFFQNKSIRAKVGCFSVSSSETIPNFITGPENA
jgi:hypothetical protein